MATPTLPPAFRTGQPGPQFAPVLPFGDETIPPGIGRITFDGRGFAEVTVPATYRLWPSTSGPGTAISFTGSFIAGTLFRITNGGFLDGYWWWVCAAGAQSTSPVKCALWQVTGIGTAVVVPNSTVTSGTLIAGQWNFIPLATPLELSTGVPYMAAIGVNGNFPDSTNYWATSGITNGILKAYSGVGGTDVPPYSSIFQGGFSTGGSDPAVTFPASASGTDNFWVDVQIDTVPTYTGVYRLWPTLNGTLADGVTVPDIAVNYVLATEVIVYTTCTVGKIWFFSPPGTAQLPTDVNIWAVNLDGISGTSVYHATPSWSGAAASGWVSTTVTGVTLPPGDYKISVFNGAGTPDQWSSKRLNYWGGTSPVAPNGITVGPIFAPSSTTPASTAYSFQPTVPGPATEAGQSTFSFTNTNVYPNVYVGNLSTGGNLYQNYWVDAEFTPVAGGVTTGGTGAIVFGGTGTATVTVATAGTGAIVFAGTGTATVTVTTTGTGAIVFGGSGTATTGTVGTGTGAIVFNGSGTGVVTLVGTGTGAIVFAGSGTATATGGPTTGTGAIIFAGTGTGVVTVTATGTGAIVFGGQGTPTSTVTATGTGAIVFGGQGIPGRFDTVGRLTASVAASSSTTGTTAAQTVQTTSVAAQNSQTGSSP